MSPYKLEKLADKVWAVDLDVAVTDKAEIDSFAAEFNTKAEVLTMHGPGGGWPLVRFTGTWIDVIRLRRTYEEG